MAKKFNFNPLSGKFDIVNTGDVVGPSSAVSGDVAAFDGVTGKLLKAGDINTANFNTSPTPGAHAAGKMYWDATWKTGALMLDGDSILQMGQETMAYVKNANVAAGLTEGQVVYIDGAASGIPTVGLADATDDAKSYVLGVVTSPTIAQGAFGYVTIRGHVNDLNTDAWTVNDVLYLDDTTPGGLTTTPPTAGNNDIRIGRVMIKDPSAGRVYVNVRPLASLDTLSDVAITSPALDNYLRYNGTEWVNSAGATVSGSAGIYFYMDDTAIIATGVNNDNEVVTLSKTPVTTTPEVVDAISVTAATSPVLKEAYLYNTALGRTSLDAGVWKFDTYASVSSTAGGRVSSIKRSVYQVIVQGMTVTTTGSGTSRTCTAASGTPFVSGDVGTDKTNSGYVQTPQGLYQITGYTSATVVTIAVPTTYSNEAGVAFNKWKYLFQIQTPTITTTGTNYALYTAETAQPAFAISATDKLGEIAFGISNNTTTVNFTHNGSARYSNFQSPLITLHNNLAGLQGGAANDYYHLTSAQTTIATQSATAARDGYLTSADWSTFNAKAPTSGPTFTGTVTLPKTLEIQDTSADHQYVLAVNELTADRTVTLPLLTGNDEFVFADHTKTLTNKRITPRITTIASAAEPTVNTDNCDCVTITAQAAAITSMTTNLSGTPTNFQKLIYRIKDDGTARAITWGASFAARGVSLPTTTTISKVLTVGFIYNTVTSTWDCIAASQEA